MSRERASHEHPTAKDFGWTVDPDREHGHVRFIDGSMIYKWGIGPSGHPVLINDDHKLSKEKRTAMKDQVSAILGPEIPSSE
jgi:hypothetical protein